jgi:hypothetical protein
VPAATALSPNALAAVPVACAALPTAVLYDPDATVKSPIAVDCPPVADAPCPQAVSFAVVAVAPSFASAALLPLSLPLTSQVSARAGAEMKLVASAAALAVASKERRIEISQSLETSAHDRVRRPAGVNEGSVT